MLSFLEKILGIQSWAYGPYPHFFFLPFFLLLLLNKSMIVV